VKTVFYKSALFIVIAACTISLLVELSVADSKVAEEIKQTVPVQTAKPTSIKPDAKKVEPAGRFIPSEKLRADDAISFPVDI